MTYFVALLLVGIASLGAFVVALFMYALMLLIVSAILLMMVMVITLAGAMGDYLHRKKVQQGKADYRLPWYLRWKGWVIGEVSEARRRRIFYDRRADKIVTISQK